MNQAISISQPAPVDNGHQGAAQSVVQATDVGELMALKGRLQNALESADKDLFCSVFADAQRRLRMDDNELAKILQVSRPTVGRWASGVTAPHPIGRKPVLEFLIKRVESSIRLLKR